MTFHSSKLNKLTVRICGGLGNQLFGFAFGQGLAAATNLPVFYDCESAYSRDLYGRKFLLKEFPLLRGRRDFSGQTKFHKVLLTPLGRVAARLAPLGFRPIVLESPGGYDASIALTKYRINTYFIGYWQSEKYFREQKRQLQNLLKLPAPTTVGVRKRIRQVKSTSSCFVHWRSYREERSDKPDVCVAYYEEALERVRQFSPRVKFYLFTDDITLSRDFFGKLLGQFHVWSDTDGSVGLLDEFSAMIACDHAIVGNSTFSWWAAWLGAQASAPRIVVAPGGLSPWGDDWPAEGWQVIRVAT